MSSRNNNFAYNNHRDPRGGQGRHTGVSERQDDSNRGSSTASFLLGALASAAVAGAVYLFSSYREGNSVMSGAEEKSGLASVNYRFPSSSSHSSSSSPLSGQDQERAAAAAAATAGDLPLTEFDSSNAHVCKVCYTEPANMLFNECGHLHCCEKCVLRMAENEREPDKEVTLKCPVCRCVSTIRKVYSG